MKCSTKSVIYVVVYTYYRGIRGYVFLQINFCNFFISKTPKNKKIKDMVPLTRRPYTHY